MDDPTGPAQGRRMIEDVDATVLDIPGLCVADLFADAATTPPAADTVLGLFCQQAAALATLTQTEFAELEPDVAELAVALALIDGAGALRRLADTAAPRDDAIAPLADTATPRDGDLTRLADVLERHAGAVLYARDSRPAPPEAGP
jgi:hypothetical protein